ncbi:hypothetical protein [Chryseolinea lacunae]|uniref:Uncharacterized protein n=1 Tax=Chryseolinea lacunae TaxID=2801331 RepID=A0ABS1KZT9_9BACT|nr:hypothetical protein [Chryseolinea lacunae]MBL0744978.1 hypothetical protein [Chryseolinea lacunae]
MATVDFDLKMKAIKILFFIVLSASTAKSYPKYASIYNGDLTYPLPTVELKYLNDFFTKELIIKKSFRDRETVPVRIELIKPQMNAGEAKDLYLTIESVQVSFVIQEDVPVRSGTYPGHLILIPISWPYGFKLEQGSRIVFVVKYVYHIKDEIVEKGEVIEQIRF